MNTDGFGEADGLAKLLATPGLADRINSRAHQLHVLSRGKVVSLTAVRLQRQREKDKGDAS